MEKKKLSDVFKTVGLPPYTYVKPKYYGEVRSDIEQSGKHLLIEGPSGIGKTCIVFKVFEELGWVNGENYEYLSCRDENAEDKVNTFFEESKRSTTEENSIMVIDDFHLFDTSKRAEIGAMLKRLSDRAFEQVSPPKAVLLGIPTTGVSLLSDAYDLGPRLGSYQFERASDTEIDSLIDNGETALNVLFDDRDILLSESEGNFWLAQYICNKVCATQEIFETQDDIEILTFDLLSIRQRLMSELSQRYMPTAKIFAKGKKWRPGGNKPYLEVLLAISNVPGSVIAYDKVINMVPERRKPGIKAIRSRVPEVIFNPIKGVDLRKQIAFDPDSGFSIEDPLFRYFLTNLDVNQLYRELGIENENIDRSRRYAYDIGFSFAGECRKIVEAINTELKAEDVITFYDYDQQAFLLALDLEESLERIYTGSCRYYLVFIDEHYKNKVWTKYEKDIMTQSGRENHLIPVVLDDRGAQGLVGLPSTIGHINLRDQWSEIKDNNGVASDVMNVIRNRCVLPLIEKLDASNDFIG